MDLAKVMAKGQVTIPINVRKKLNLEGDKLVFIEKDGNMVIANSAITSTNPDCLEVKLTPGAQNRAGCGGLS